MYLQYKQILKKNNYVRKTCKFFLLIFTLINIISSIILIVRYVKFYNNFKYL